MSSRTSTSSTCPDACSQAEGVMWQVARWWSRRLTACEGEGWPPWRWWWWFWMMPWQNDIAKRFPVSVLSHDSIFNGFGCPFQIFCLPSVPGLHHPPIKWASFFLFHLFQAFLCFNLGSFLPLQPACHQVEVSVTRPNGAWFPSWRARGTQASSPQGLRWWWLVLLEDEDKDRDDEDGSISIQSVLLANFDWTKGWYCICSVNERSTYNMVSRFETPFIDQGSLICYWGCNSYPIHPKIKA